MFGCKLKYDRLFFVTFEIQKPNPWVEILYHVMFLITIEVITKKGVFGIFGTMQQANLTCWKLMIKFKLKLKPCISKLSSYQIVEINYRNTEKKDLIESKKLICLNDFLWFKEMICLNEIKFVWFKQNIFEPNKYLFESN